MDQQARPERNARGKQDIISGEMSNVSVAKAVAGSRFVLDRLRVWNAIVSDQEGAWFKVPR